MNLNARIRAWREHLGLRVTDLAKQVGVSTAAVSQWEREENGTAPSHDNLAAIASAFGLSMAEFWGAIPKAKKQAS